MQWLRKLSWWLLKPKICKLSNIHVEVIGGVRGIRELVDACFLEALKDIGPQWEGIAIKWLSQCVVDGELSERGIELWTSMRADMGDSVARRGGTFHA